MQYFASHSIVMLHHWRRSLLALRLAANGYLPPCAPRLSLFMHMCSRQDEWSRLCTGTQSNSNSVSSVDSSEDEGCPKQRKHLTESAIHRRAGVVRSPILDEAVASFLDLGFSNVQVTQLLVLCEAGGARPERSMTIVSELLLLGLSPGTVLKTLQRSPDVQRLTAKQLKDRVEYLRRLGLGEGGIQRVITQFPSLLMVSKKHVDAVVRCLKEFCLFSSQQVIEIVRTCPGILTEEPQELEYKFQYAHFRLGIQHQEAVKSRLFQFGMLELKYRHTFLERLGRYQTPDKKGQTQICNPKLKEVIGVSEDFFLSNVAFSTPKEFQIFKKLMKREEEEQMEEDDEVGSSE